MLPCSLRLRQSEAKQVLRAGVFCRKPEASFRYLFQPDSKQASRFAVAVSSRVVKKSAARNLVKRRAYSVLRKNFGIIRPGYQVIIYPSGQLAAKDYSQLEKAILSGLQEVGFLNNHKA